MNRQHFLGLFAGALAAGITAVPAFAEEGHGKRPATAGEKANRGASALAKRHGAQGTIKSISGATFVLTTKQGELTVNTNADTEYHAPKEESVSFASLKAGMHVMVQGERPSETALLAHRVNIRPDKGSDEARAERKAEREEKRAEKGRIVTVGVINGLPGSGAITGFTVTPQGGSAVTFVANADTEYSLKGATLANGQTVRVVSKKDGASNVALKVRYPAGA